MKAKWVRREAKSKDQLRRSDRQRQMRETPPSLGYTHPEEIYYVSSTSALDDARAITILAGCSGLSTRRIELDGGGYRSLLQPSPRRDDCMHDQDPSSSSSMR